VAAEAIRLGGGAATTTLFPPSPVRYMYLFITSPCLFSSAVHARVQFAQGVSLAPEDQRWWAAWEATFLHA
jgi:hypothetical protein